MAENDYSSGTGPSLGPPTTPGTPGTPITPGTPALINPDLTLSTPSTGSTPAVVTTPTFISNPSGVGVLTGGVNTLVWQNGGLFLGGQVVGPARGVDQPRGAIYERTEFIKSCQDVYVQEKHLSVVRKGPTAPVTLSMFSFVREDQNNDDKVDIENEFFGDEATHLASDGSSVSVFFDSYKNRKAVGDIVELPIDQTSTGDGEDFKSGDVVIISYEYTDYLGIYQETTCRAVIQLWDGTSTSTFVQLLQSTNGFPLITDDTDVYTVKLVQDDPMFKLKFPRFSYRYKYEDGEYSVFAPWSEVAFIPGEFDYLPKKGYNLGMVNRLRALKVMDWVPKGIPKDVVQVDLLYKESNGPNVYTVESFKRDDEIVGSRLTNYWNTPGTGSNFGNYTVTSELIHAVVPSNQMLRPWDNVPRKALAQDITANRLIFANYLQNYNIRSSVNSTSEIKPIFTWALSGDLDQPATNVKLPAKSLKSMRSYQLGIVYRDRYGRETPVLTSKTGLFKIKKDRSLLYNRIEVGMSSPAPDWAESFTYYIKETSNEYYNVAMDRWYDAEDGGVWVSFPSSERNKIQEDGVLILKKQHETDTAVVTDEEYKVIDIKNSPPTFIKTDTRYWGSVDMMLPPPGWGIGSKPGGWQSGMFVPTGIPKRNRIYIDIYKEYVEATILAGIKDALKDGVEIRITQTPGQASALTTQATTHVNKSDWYQVAQFTQTTEDPATHIETTLDPNDPNTTIETEVEASGSADPVMRITLEKRMGDDMLFTEPAGGLDLSRGLAIECKTHKVRDKAQFQGRFFVKLHRSSDFVTNVINTSTKETENLVVVESRGVKYLCDGHPGVQDWSYMTPALSPTPVAAPYTNYIPPGQNIYKLRPGQANINDGYDGWKNPNGASKGRPFSVVSSYGYAGKSATFLGVNGQVYGSPDGTNASQTPPDVAAYEKWPYGPGPHDGDPFSSFPTSAQADLTQQSYKGLPITDGWGPGSWFSTSYKNHVNADYQPYFWEPRYAKFREWPSFISSSWEPGVLHPGHAISAGVTDGSPGLVLLEEDGFVFRTTSGGAAMLHQDTSIASSLFGDAYRSNPYQMPAIWGDNDAMINSTTGNYTFGADTITSLNRDWMGYYNTGTGGNTYWPFVKTNWSRWFIDKVGAAEGYGGHGEYVGNDGVSHMSISYWGIGASDDRTDRDPHDLSAKQPFEMQFANMISTVGTMFRFKQDPDQIVYTVTSANAEPVHNYEAFRGSWGCVDQITYDPGGGYIKSQIQTGEFNTGSSTFKHLLPNSGPMLCGHQRGMGGRKAFYSDLYHDFDSTGTWKRTGRHFTNNRIRINITLDKAIGGGPNAFHPITNHVDENGIANIEQAGDHGARLRYDSDIASHVKTEKGGTPVIFGLNSNSGYEMYNLSSYWNINSTKRALIQANGYQQPHDSSDAFYDEPTDGSIAPYIGLHERGLNQTTIEILEYYDENDGDQKMSNNPAIFETEPKEDVGLDIYYAASPSFPINTKRFRYDTDEVPGWSNFNLRGEEFVKVGGNNTPHGYAKIHIPSGVPPVGSTPQIAIIDGVQENIIFLNTPLMLDANGDPLPPDVNDIVEFTVQGDGVFYGAGIDVTFVRARITKVMTPTMFVIESNAHTSDNKVSLSYFNCYSFANGVESNRIRDDYNAVTIDKGVKASAPLATGYEEERKKSSLIFSGIYNSTSGINSTNQFIQAEPITKDLNPINGSIQKIYARDTDLVTFCENKVFKILAKKDALFNADGNTNVTSNAAVLGATIPFSGEYGISRNPESFAAESYRLYFTDKDRGTVMRLSKDGLTPISDKGMKDWFKDNLMHASTLIGSFDTREDHYNLSIDTKDQDNITNAYTLTFTESKGGGWESFKSFIKQGGISYKNKYYTFASNKFNYDKNTAPGSKSEILYGEGEKYGKRIGMAEMWQHHVDLDFHRVVANSVNGSTQVSLVPSSQTSVVTSFMNVEGNGIPIDTVVSSSVSGGNVIILNKPVHINAGEKIKFTTPRNNFYATPSHSMVRTLMNGAQGSVKRFKTINYEGTQGKVLGQQGVDYYTLSKGNNLPINVGQNYSNNIPKKGWEVFEITTDLQKGTIREFIAKENKWFNYIRGHAPGGDAGSGDNFDTAEFSVQGLGFTNL